MEIALYATRPIFWTRLSCNAETNTFSVRHALRPFSTQPSSSSHHLSFPTSSPRHHLSKDRKGLENAQQVAHHALLSSSSQPSSFSTRTMNAVISASDIKTFYSALHCLSRFSESFWLQCSPRTNGQAQIRLSAINPTNSAFCMFAFDPDFFLNVSTESNQKIECQIQLKVRSLSLLSYITPQVFMTDQML